MYRTHTCGQLRAANVNETVTLAGWVQKVRNLGAMTFIDLRDRYGITQIVVEEHSPADVKAVAGGLGREYVLQVEGRVVERSSKNPKMPTGDIEVVASKLVVLHEAEVPPFTIEENSDGGDDLRMKYRYLDLRRPPLQRNMILRHKMAQEIRRFLSDEGFLEIETPYLVNSTPEGARDFVVPSRMSPNQFYALPQSPQTLKQLLMVAGYDKYFQIVRCFRDEDLRADRQPEFTQIDCEMSFVEQEDVLEIFERWAKHMFKHVMGIELTEPLRRMPWIEAMEKYGSDKPDLRFGMEFAEITDLAKGHGFSVFDEAEYITGFAATGCAAYTRKQIDSLTEFVKRQQIGAKGLVWIRVAEDGVKSSIDKFYSPEEVRAMAERCGAVAGDMVFILCGKKFKTLTQLCALRLEVAQQLGLRDPQKILARVDWQGKAIIDEMQRNNEKVIFLVPHAWGVDIPAMLMASGGQKMAAMFHNQGNPVFDYVWNTVRRRFGGRMHARNDGIKPFIQSVRQGYWGYYLPDQDHGAEHSEFVDFFATYKATLPAIGRLMKVCRARVVPLFPVYDGKTHRLTVLVRPPMDDLLDADDTTIARRMNEEVEVFVKPHTEQYTWILKLLKTRKPGEIEPYKRKELFPKKK